MTGIRKKLGMMEGDIHVIEPDIYTETHTHAHTRILYTNIGDTPAQGYTRMRSNK